LPWKSNSGDNPDTQPYKYENKEFIEQHGYDAYDSKARMYYPAIMRTETMDPLAEKYYPISPYAWCGNNPVRIVDPTGEDVYLYYYVNGNTHNGRPDPGADAMFWASALSRSRDMLENGTIKEGDAYVIRSVSDLGTIGDLVQQDVEKYSPQFGKTAEFGLWSHGALEGPIGSEDTSGPYKLDDHQMSPEGWGNINFNWKEGDAKALFYGCRTATEEPGQATAWARTISRNPNMENVAVYGQTVRSWPSESPDRVYSPSGTPPYLSYLGGNIYMVGAGERRGGINGIKRTFHISYPAYPMAKYINGVRLYTK